MELTGKIIAEFNERGGVSNRTGNEWKAKSYVLEVPGEYPRKLVFDVFGVDRLQAFNIQIGEQLTVHFDIDFSEDTIFGRNPFRSLQKMMKEAQKGLSFSMDAIMKVYPMLCTLSTIKDGFYAFQQFLSILYELSLCPGARALATSSYAKVEVASDSRRVLKVKNYINQNYMHEIRLNDMADIAGMSPSAFSRFFKLHTGRNLTDYIIDMRLGYASRMLVDSTHSIAEIGYGCGFNNLSNFNRIFRKKKGCSPSEFRENYHKTRIIV